MTDHLLFFFFFEQKRKCIKHQKEKLHQKLTEGWTPQRTRWPTGVVIVSEKSMFSYNRLLEKETSTSLLCHRL